MAGLICVSCYKREPMHDITWMTRNWKLDGLENKGRIKCDWKKVNKTIPNVILLYS